MSVDSNALVPPLLWENLPKKWKQTCHGTECHWVIASCQCSATTSQSANPTLGIDWNTANHRSSPEAIASICSNVVMSRVYLKGAGEGRHCQAARQSDQKKH